MVSSWILTKKNFLGLGEAEGQSGDIKKVLALLWTMENTTVSPGGQECELLSSGELEGGARNPQTQHSQLGDSSVATLEKGNGVWSSHYAFMETHNYVENDKYHFK